MVHSIRKFLGGLAIVSFYTFLASAQLQASTLQSQNVSDKELAAKLLQLTYNCQFDEGKSLANQVRKQDSLSMKWNFLYAMVLWRSMHMEGMAEGVEDEFENVMGRVIKVGEDRLANNSQDTVALFYTGAADGFLGEYYSASGSNFRAVSIGKKALELHKKLLEISPDCYDAYLCLGLFNFYASKVPWYIKPLMWIFGQSGSEEKAEEYLSLVSSKGDMAVYEARETLASLYYKRKDYQRAGELLKSLALQFPGNRLYAAQAMGILYYALQRDSDVIEIGEKTLEGFTDRTHTMTRTDSAWLPYVYADLGLAYSREGSIQKAIENYREVIDDKMDGRLNPQTRSSVYIDIAHNYEKEQNYENAIYYYKALLEFSKVSQHREEAQARIDSLTKIGKK